LGHQRQPDTTIISEPSLVIKINRIET